MITTHRNVRRAPKQWPVISSSDGESQGEAQQSSDEH
jgi:hypothetical protein